MTNGQRVAVGLAAAVGSLGFGIAAVGIYQGNKRLRQAQPRLLGTASMPAAQPRQVAPPSRERVRTGGMTLRSYDEKVLTIGQRAALLQDFVAKAVKNPQMRKYALEATRGCKWRDGLCEAQAIYDWMREPVLDRRSGRMVPRIRYTGDIAAHARSGGGRIEPVDLFQRPERTIEFGGGDCDDHAMLASTLAILNGIPARLRISAPSRDGQVDDWSHVYAVIGLPKENPTRWIAVDTTLGRTGLERLFGIEAPHGKHMDFVA